MQSLKQNWLLVSNMTWGIRWVFTKPLKSLDILPRWARFSQVYKVWANKKKIQWSYLSWHWTVVQNLNTPNLWILMRARANLKNYTSHVLLLSKVYYVWAQKKYRGVICHNMENDIKFEKELVSKNGVRNLANFDATLKICTLMVFFWQKYVMIELKKCRGVLHHYAEYRCKLWRKNDLRFHK